MYPNAIKNFIFKALFPMLAVCVLHSQADGVENPSMTNAKSDVRVRVKLSLKPYAHVNVRGSDSKITQRLLPQQKMDHVLRARLDSQNHFYVSDFHIETIPVRWHQSSRQYSLLVNIYKRFGNEDESVEEKIGSTRIDGILEQHSPQLYSFIGQKEVSFSNSSGQKSLELVAGFTNSELINDRENATKYSKLEQK